MGGKDKYGKKKMTNDELSDMIIKILNITEWWIDWYDDRNTKNLINNIMGVSESSQKTATNHCKS